jgi:hypothetical protein
MATVTSPPRSQPTPAAPATVAAPKPISAPPDLDPLRPHFGDRIAFAVWITCALFMAALLTYDSFMGLFR